MKKIFLILSVLFSLMLNAQVPCPNDNSFWLDLTPTGVGNTNTSFCTYAGDYDTFTACNGVQYGINVCGSYNIGVTMYDNSGNLLYSQNTGGIGVCETFTWTSTLNGVVRVLIDRANCGTNTTCSQVDITQLTACSTTTSSSGNQDCDNRTLICNDASFSGNSSGFSIQELPNNGTIDGCLTLEHQSSWYVFQAATSGTVSLTIQTAIDYDFAIWGPNVGCGALGSPIRCSYSGLSGNTGLGNGATDPTDGDGTGANGALDKWVLPLPIIAGQTYIMLIDNFTANSTAFTLDWTMTGGASLACSSLPIELLYFTGDKLSCGDNKLIWETASESNNELFKVEHSSNGVDFKEIGNLAGAGTSVTNIKYSFRDTNPVQELNYYRLKQIDLDGTYNYSPIISIDNSCDKNIRTLKILNLLGQEVDESYSGVIFIYRSDNTILKRLQYEN